MPRPKKESTDKVKVIVKRGINIEEGKAIPVGTVIEITEEQYKYFVKFGAVSKDV